MSHDVVLIALGGVWLLEVKHLVELVVDNLSEVDDGTLLELHLALGVELQSGGVNEAVVTDVVSTVDLANHELGLPKLLVIWNVKVTGLSLTDLVHGAITLNRDLEVLELLSVDGLELEDHSLVGDAEGSGMDDLSAEIALGDGLDLKESHLADFWVTLEDLAN